MLPVHLILPQNLLHFPLARFTWLSLLFAVAVCLLPLIDRAAGVNPPGFHQFPAGEYQSAGLNPKEPEVVIELQIARSPVELPE